MQQFARDIFRASAHTRITEDWIHRNDIVKISWSYIWLRLSGVSATNFVIILIHVILIAVQMSVSHIIIRGCFNATSFERLSQALQSQLTIFILPLLSSITNYTNRIPTRYIVNCYKNICVLYMSTYIRTRVYNTYYVQYTYMYMWLARIWMCILLRTEMYLHLYEIYALSLTTTVVFPFV